MQLYLINRAVTPTTQAGERVGVTAQAIEINKAANSAN
jgi:hypothetical protein